MKFLPWKYIYGSFLLDKDKKFLENFHFMFCFHKEPDRLILQLFIAILDRYGKLDTFPEIITVAKVPVTRLVPKTNIVREASLQAHSFKSLMVCLKCPISQYFIVFEPFTPQIVQSLPWNLLQLTILRPAQNRKASP